MAAPTYQDVTAISGQTGALNMPWPTHQTDDIGIIFVNTSSTQPATLATAAGFAAGPNNPQDTGGGAAGCSFSWFWCRATSGAMTTPQIADSGNHQIAAMVTIRGCVTSGNPWDVTSGSTKTSASTSASFPTVLTSLTDILVVQSACHAIDTRSASGGTWASEANASLASLTERLDASRDDGAGGGIVIYTGGKATAGTVSATTATLAVSSVESYFTIGLKSPTSTSGGGAFQAAWARGSNVVLS